MNMDNFTIAQNGSITGGGNDQAGDFTWQGKTEGN